MAQARAPIADNQPLLGAALEQAAANAVPDLIVRVAESLAGSDPPCTSFERDPLPVSSTQRGDNDPLRARRGTRGETMTPKLPPLADVLNLLPDAVCVVDTEGRFLFVSASFETIFGYAPDEVLGRRAFDLVHPDDRDATMQQADQVTAGTWQRHFRNRYIHKDGHSVDVQWSAHWLPDYGVRIGVGREVSELRRTERDLEHRALHDALTGLPNRHSLQRALQQAIEDAVNTDGCFALLYLDLDGFKAANDRSGHSAGDRVLREVAQRLQDGLRQTDFVARVGGDEFVVLLPGCSDPTAAHAFADRLRAHLHPPYVMPDGPLHLDASIGIAFFPVDGSDPDALLAHADRAMYAAKREAARRRHAGVEAAPQEESAL